MTTLDALLADLAAEGSDLDALVAPLDGAGWRSPTPAEGWDVATQIAHLAWTDEAAIAASRAASGEPAEWSAVVTTAMEDVGGFVDTVAYAGAQAAPVDLLDRWRTGRRNLEGALRSVPSGARLPWFGPPMSTVSMATARLMETWAHGLDVADALGVVREPTARIRHVAHIGVRTRDFAFVNNGLEPPAEEFRVDLTGPDGDTWSWGPEGAAQSVRGPAYDFCVLVTQRRHRDDLALRATGPDAERWLTIAQAFAGPAGGGRRPTDA
ncbi:MAG: TIGR03084 family metal-binding protein [Marmoricola sp.]